MPRHTPLRTNRAHGAKIVWPAHDHSKSQLHVVAGTSPLQHMFAMALHCAAAGRRAWGLDFGQSADVKLAHFSTANRKCQLQSTYLSSLQILDRSAHR